MHSQAGEAALKMMQPPNDENRHGRAFFLTDYIQHLGCRHQPTEGFREGPRLPGIEEYLAEA